VTVANPNWASSKAYYRWAACSPPSAVISDTVSSPLASSSAATIRGACSRRHFRPWAQESA
jgi:hypothetical protein